MITNDNVAANTADANDGEQNKNMWPLNKKKYVISWALLFQLHKAKIWFAKYENMRILKLKKTCQDWQDRRMVKFEAYDFRVKCYTLYHLWRHQFRLWRRLAHRPHYSVTRTELFETLFKRRNLKTLALRKKHFRNKADDVMIIMWKSSSNANPKWSAIAACCVFKFLRRSVTCGLGLSN